MRGSDLQRYLEQLEAWDPAEGDLPDELALALDESDELRARFDARFARWQPAQEPVPERLEERVMPEAVPQQRSTLSYFLIGAGGAGVIALAATTLLALGLVGVGLTAGSMSASPVATMALEEPAEVPPVAVVEPMPAPARVGGEAEVHEMLEAMGYVADREQNEPVDPNTRKQLLQLGYVTEEEDPKAANNLDRVSGRDGFVDHGVNGWIDANRVPQSTFAIDVDRGSYTFARRRLREGFLPDPSSVRVEEFVNAMHYDYPEPEEGPLTVQFEASPSPWNDARHLVRVGLQGRRPASRMPVHLTFLVDTSGSMSSQDRLPLVKESLRLLTGELDGEDTVAIVTYAGSAGVALSPTSGDRKDVIGKALSKLESGGSTAMGQGIGLAYALAEQTRRDGHVNRVIIASDGDANVGITDVGQLNQMIRGYAERGITLTTLGVGEGNYQDARMEQLANEGDGNYFYIDNLGEARRVLVDELSSTLEVIAKDVKLQIEWNPHVVRRYRLVGYENRMLQNREFRDDAVDAGEIGAGHTVTALYVVELVPGTADPIATVRLRSKPPGQEAAASEREFRLPRGALQPSFAQSSRDHRMSVAMAAFAERLRGSPFVAGVGYSEIASIARDASRPGDPGDIELLELISRAQKLSGPDADPKCKAHIVTIDGQQTTLRLDDLGHPCN
jgi:Ca-activated chloride channel family protein